MSRPDAGVWPVEQSSSQTHDPNTNDPSVAALDMRGITVRFGDRTILDRVNLSVRPGELVSLIGPNGAGKSALFHVASGELSPASGTVRLFGDLIGRLPSSTQARRRAIQLQDHHVSYAYQVREVVRMGRWPWRATPYAQDDEAAIDAGLAEGDVEHLTTRQVTTLSGGERARATYARTFAQQGRLVMLDEPTAALDIKHQERILASLRALTEQGAAVVTVLHDLNLAAAHSDRLVLLGDGVVVADGPPSEVLTAELVSQVYDCQVDVFTRPDGSGPVVLPALNSRRAPSDPASGNYRPWGLSNRSTTP